MVASTNLATKERFMNSLAENDMAAVKACCHPDLVCEQSPHHPYGGTYRGADQFVEMIGKLFNAYQVEEMQDLRHFVADDEDHLVFHFHLRGSTADGRPLDSSVLEHWRFEDGLIREVVVHWFDIP